ncbi:MAG: 4-hydroxyphenylpyruvate dioxygenase [Hormoscilla sp.]
MYENEKLTMQIDRIHFYVEDARKWRDWFADILGFQPVASGTGDRTRTEVVASGEIYFALSAPLSTSSRVASYLQQHPEGVADVALRVADANMAMKNAIARGAKVIQATRCDRHSQWGTIGAVGGLCHTLIQRRVPSLPLPPGINWDSIDRQTTNPQDHFTGIDHVVINVPAGELNPTARWYEEMLGFSGQQQFIIETGRSGLRSVVMKHPVSGVQMPLNEPTSANSQIQEFLDYNRGAGVQHIALKTSNIIKTVGQLKAGGLEFLSVPGSYYRQLQQRCESYLSPGELESIESLQILVDLPDANSGSLLLQIFTQPIFGEPTFFWEIIERQASAKGFGEGNFRALFQAIEQQQQQRGVVKTSW